MIMLKWSSVTYFKVLLDQGKIMPSALIPTLLNVILLKMRNDIPHPN